MERLLFCNKRYGILITVAISPDHCDTRSITFTYRQSIIKSIPSLPIKAVRGCLYLSKSRRSETGLSSSSIKSLDLCISESRRPETFTMRIDKASVVILDRSRKETPSASQAGDSSRCIS